MATSHKRSSSFKNYTTVIFAFIQISWSFNVKQLLYLTISLQNKSSCDWYFIPSKHNVLHIHGNTTAIIIHMRACRWPPKKQNMFTYQSWQHYKFKTCDRRISQVSYNLNTCFVWNRGFKQKHNQHQMFPNKTQIIITHLINSYNKLFHFIYKINDTHKFTRMIHVVEVKQLSANNHEIHLGVPCTITCTSFQRL